MFEREELMAVRTARTSLSNNILTALVLIMTAGFCIAALREPRLLIAGALLAGISLLRCLLAPVGYDLADGMLTVRFRFEKKRFGPIVRCSRPTQRVRFSIRLFGNGGLFAGTGIFWNRSYGVFRAYVTSARPTDLVLVETPRRRIIISPEHPEKFIESCPTLEPADAGDALECS
jgi:hypothetical protein